MANSSPGRSFIEEFRPVKFGLGYPDPNLFVRSQWQIPKWGYLIWRLFWFLWHVGWIIASGVNTRVNLARYPEEGVKWFIYLTNTTLLLTTLTSTVDFVIVLYVTAFKGGAVVGPPSKVQRKNTVTSSTDQGADSHEEIVFQGEFTLVEGIKQHTTTWYLKCLWFLYNVISSCNIVITILYWTVEYDGNTTAVGVEVHSINTVFILLNLLVTAMPIQILHVIYPMAYAALYLLFNFIYIISGGTDIEGRHVIYTVIDWSKAVPTAIVVVLGVLVAVPLAHALVFAIYTFRVFVHSKIYSHSLSSREYSFRRSNNKTADVVIANTSGT